MRDADVVGGLFGDPEYIPYARCVRLLAIQRGIMTELCCGGGKARVNLQHAVSQQSLTESQESWFEIALDEKM